MFCNVAPGVRSVCYLLFEALLLFAHEVQSLFYAGHRASFMCVQEFAVVRMHGHAPEL